MYCSESLTENEYFYYKTVYYCNFNLFGGQGTEINDTSSLRWSVCILVRVFGQTCQCVLVEMALPPLIRIGGG